MKNRRSLFAGAQLPEHLMPDPEIPRSLLKQNLVDQVANSAIGAVDATRTAADSAFESVRDKVESARSTLSPALDSALHAAIKYTRDEPLKALVAAFASGALWMALLHSGRARRR
jgi:hypothetical protein